MLHVIRNATAGATLLIAPKPRFYNGPDVRTTGVALPSGARSLCGAGADPVAATACGAQAALYLLAHFVCSWA